MFLKKKKYEKEEINYLIVNSMLLNVKYAVVIIIFSTAHYTYKVILPGMLSGAHTNSAQIIIIKNAINRLKISSFSLPFSVCRKSRAT